MLFENLVINRIIIHEVFKRSDDRTIVPPNYGNALVVLDQSALDALRDRVISAMGSASRSMEMSIVHTDDSSAVAIARDLVDADDELFISRSRAVADKLTNAQSRRDIPGGILVVFTGSVGHPAKRVLGLIKAETHNGFTRQVGTSGSPTLKFLTDLILTPQTKLYKIGAFIEFDPDVTSSLSDGWKAIIYDDLMTASNRLGAAQYFYEGFLGCAFPETSARLTKTFHDLTKSFIRGLDIPEENKSDLHNALVTYLKVDQSATVEVSAFAQTYLPDPELRDAYAQFMLDKEFPQNAVPKDLTDVAGELKHRKIYFTNDIKLIAPADKFEKLVRMRVIDGDEDEQGQTPKWTEIIIRDRIRAQE